MGIISGLIKRGLCYGSVIFLFNYGYIPFIDIIHARIQKSQIKDTRIQKVCNVDQSLKEISQGLKESNKALLYLLKSAHALSSKYLTYKAGGVFDIEKEIALKEGKADCSYFSIFTYSNFLYLAEKLNKEEFKDKVRLRGGFIKDSQNQGGHVWIEIYLNNKWCQYEAVVDFFQGGDQINFRNLDNIIKDCFVINSDGERTYYSSSFIQYENENLVVTSNPFFSWETGFDIKHLIWKSIKEKIKK